MLPANASAPDKKSRSAPEASTQPSRNVGTTEGFKPADEEEAPESPWWLSPLFSLRRLFSLSSFGGRRAIMASCVAGW